MRYLACFAAASLSVFAFAGTALANKSSPRQPVLRVKFQRIERAELRLGQNHFAGRFGDTAKLDIDLVPPAGKAGMTQVHSHWWTRSRTPETLGAFKVKTSVRWNDIGEVTGTKVELYAPKVGTATLVWSTLGEPRPIALYRFGTQQQDTRLHLATGQNRAFTEWNGQPLELILEEVNPTLD
jgi:hypothetical protein